MSTTATAATEAPRAAAAGVHARAAAADAVPASQARAGIAAGDAIGDDAATATAVATIDRISARATHAAAATAAAMPTGLASAAVATACRVARKAHHVDDYIRSGPDIDRTTGTHSAAAAAAAAFNTVSQAAGAAFRMAIHERKIRDRHRAAVDEENTLGPAAADYKVGSARAVDLHITGDEGKRSDPAGSVCERLAAGTDRSDLSRSAT